MKGLSVSRSHRGPIVRRTPDWRSAFLPCGTGLPALELSQSTDLVEFFAPALRALASCHWLLEDVGFALPAQWEQRYDSAADEYRGPELDAFRAAILASRCEGVTLDLAGPGFLAEYAHYIADDWCAIIALREAPGDPDALLDSYGSWARPRTELFGSRAPGVEAVFFCIDGVRWEAYTREARLLDPVRQRVEPREDLRVWDVDLRSTPG